MATFTLPHGLRPRCRGHQTRLYDLRLQASQQALQTLAADPRHLGGTLGLIGVLHRWTRDLRYHPHVHSLIPGGGLTPHGHTWRAARPNYLLPENPLAKLVRATFRDLLKQAGRFAQVPREGSPQGWVVDIIAVGSGEAALKSLAPYSFRVAISARHILDLTDGQVTFRSRDSTTNAPRLRTLPAERFIGRLLQHVLPRGFQQVRTYGLLPPKPRHLFFPESRATQHVACRPGAMRCPRCTCEMLQLHEIRRRRGPP